MKGNVDIEILYEDNHLIFVKKPFAIPVQKDKSNDLDVLTMVKSYIKQKYQKPGNVFLGLVHRLDRQAGGVMVFAKTSKAASRLSEQIRNRSVEKEYFAIVNGVPRKAEGILEDYLLKDKSKNLVKVVKEYTKGSKIAKLKYKIFERNEKENTSLVLVNLETGRSHQIRVQLSNSGFPILGDIKYGGAGNLGYSGICLWARRLKILHPIKQEPLEIEAQIPDLKPWRSFKV